MRTNWPPAAVLGVVRGSYGLLQLAAPAVVAERLLGGQLDARGKVTARVLGARQLGQAVASGRAPSYPVLALGVEVDLLHAVSMLGLALVDRRRRAAAGSDALIATAFALAGGLAAGAAARDPRPPRDALDQMREACAHRLAKALVPGYAKRRPTQFWLRRRRHEMRTR